MWRDGPSGSSERAAAAQSGQAKVQNTPQLRAVIGVLLGIVPLTQSESVCGSRAVRSRKTSEHAAVEVGGQRAVDLLGVGQVEPRHDLHKRVDALSQPGVVQLLLADGARRAALGGARLDWGGGGPLRWQGVFMQRGLGPDLLAIW